MHIHNALYNTHYTHRRCTHIIHCTMHTIHTVAHHSITYSMQEYIQWPHDMVSYTTCFPTPHGFLHPTSLSSIHHHITCFPHRNPQQADVFLSASGDCTFKIWDVRQPVSSLTVRAHQNEILTADWCKYNDCIVATGSTDKTIKLWDVRMPEHELRTLFAHAYVAVVFWWFLLFCLCLLFVLVCPCCVLLWCLLISLSI